MGWKCRPQLEAADVIDITVDGIGTLSNAVIRWAGFLACIVVA